MALRGSSPPTIPNTRTEEPGQAQAFLPGAQNLDETPSPATAVPPLAPSGESIRPGLWLGYWDGGGDITDLSQREHNHSTVEAAMTHYVGVDLFGIL